MSSFKGSFAYTVDNKGRIALPAKLRKNVMPAANDSFVVTRGFEKCLYLYPQDEWNRLEEKVRALSFADAQHRFFVRTLFEWATDCQLDTQSRFSVPQTLLDFAGIAKEKEVMVIGVLERVEIWDPAVFGEYKKNQPATYETVAETLLHKT
ncbi:MAG: division/cell wall cluster transcriptional repressor MraZ [Ignavibacteriales bacterium]|nr:division/cell wall cluster transcriptional repressor MraZ [Ignavibacteriales bacterium]